MIRPSATAPLPFALVLPGVRRTSGCTVQAAKPPLDPNERICKEIEVNGVRMATREVCNACQWPAREQLDREEIQQLQRPIQECLVKGTRRSWE